MTIDVLSILQSVDNNNHFLTRYDRFIKSCLAQNKSARRVEHHHICPASFFPQFKSFGDNPWNEAKLTPRQHFIAHWILWKAYGRSMTVAFFLMSSGKSNSGASPERITSKVYEVLREAYCKEKSASMTMKNWYTDGKSNSFSESPPDDTYYPGRSNMPNIKNAGTIWYTDGVTSKKFRDGDDIPSGWAKGRVFKNKDLMIENQSKSRANKCWFTNGIDETYCAVENAPKGWVNSRCDSWKEKMSGLTHSDETKRMISEANSGKVRSEDSKQRIRDAQKKLRQEPDYVHPMKDKQHSEHTRSTLSEKAKNRQRSECPHCKKVMDVANLSRYHGDNCKSKVVEELPTFNLWHI